MTKRTLKTAEPIIVPKPTSEPDAKTPMKEVNSSGAEPPAAMKVAPAVVRGRVKIWGCRKVGGERVSE